MEAGQKLTIKKMIKVLRELDKMCKEANIHPCLHLEIRSGQKYEFTDPETGTIVYLDAGERFARLQVNVWPRISEQWAINKYLSQKTRKQ